MSSPVASSSVVLTPTQTPVETRKKREREVKVRYGADVEPKAPGSCSIKFSPSMPEGLLGFTHLCERQPRVKEALLKELSEVVFAEDSILCVKRAKLGEVLPSAEKVTASVVKALAAVAHLR